MTSIKGPILLLIWFLISSLCLQAEIMEEPFNDLLPSEQTKQEINSISTPPIELRQAPDEDGFAQKEVPLKGVDLSVLLLLAGGIITYTLVKRRTKNKARSKLILAFGLLLFASVQQVNAQMAFSANPDNAFIVPNSIGYTPIDVLYNDYYNFGSPTDCNRSELVIKLWNGSAFVSSPVNGTLGRARVRVDNQIEYLPTANKYGADKITYQIYCSKLDKTSQADIYINVNDKPESISDADCYVDPVGISFEMELLAQTGLTPDRTTPAITPLVADVDNDGSPEIIVMGNYEATTANYGNCNHILIYSYNKVSKALALKYAIPLPARMETFGDGCISIAKITGNNLAHPSNYPSLFVCLTRATVGPLLMRYDFNGTTWNQKWSTTIFPSYINALYNSGTPNVVDLMGDGNKQVLILDKIYNADTGVLLAQAKDGVNLIIPQITGTYSTYGLGFGGHGSATGRHSSWVVGDIDKDGILEIIGGDCVYKANITNNTGTGGNTFSLIRRANRAGHAEAVEGLTSIADIDNDGNLDIIVASPVSEGGNAASLSLYGSVYIYNPRTGQVMHTNRVNNIPRNPAEPTQPTKGYYGPSRPFIGDIDADGVPEICLTSYLTLRAYKLEGDQLNLLWDLPTTDTSSYTTLSIFDFTQEGRARLVYRDEDELRIIQSVADASSPTGQSPMVNATVTGIFSPTVNEYPIVADINGDGAAEIIVTGTDKKWIDAHPNWNWNARVRIYAAKGAKKWAPAREVWNQIAYNPVYVNDDLTIPAHPISPATSFACANGSFDRPYNNFLQQSTSLNKEGKMIMLGPDLTFNPRVPKRLVYDTSNNLHVSVGVLNQGDAVFTGPISFQLFAYVEATDIYIPVGAAYSYPNAGGLSHQIPNNAASISYVIPNISSALPASFANLVMTVNLNTNPKHLPEFKGSVECLGGYNNFASGFSLVNGDRVMCEGSTETLALEGVGTYTVKWFTQASGGNSVHTGTSMNITKNSDPLTHYFVECYSTPGSISPITNIRDTVFVYLAPDSLVWTGKGNTSDWHDWQNWYDPSETLALRALVPRLCTHVAIPAGITLYPNLNDPETIYTKYIASECNNIHFAHGGEVVRPDMLTYSKAFVDVTFYSHRWHLFAPPLKDFYTGDLYLNNIIPASDIIKSYTKYWARRNPWTTYYTPNWTGLFHQPNQSFVAGQAMGVWISDKSVSGQLTPPRDPFDFSFPKHESQYYIYVEDTTIPTNDPKNPYQTSRTDSHRFIFDNAALPGMNFNLKIDGESITAGQVVLVGNPFMSHLDFDKFYAANSTLIQNYYAILDANAVQQHYNKDASSTLSKNIAPMQGFLVEVKAPFANLIANGTMTLSVPGDKMKSALETEAENPDFHLKVTASQGDASHETFIRFSENGTDNYKAGEDIAGLFPSSVTSDTRSIILYSQSKDGMKTSLNNQSAKELRSKSIPLGLWSPKKGASDLMLNVSNLNLLPAGYTLYLYDKLQDKSYDLSLNSMQSFESVTADDKQFIDNRFFLKFAYAGSSIEEGKSDDGLFVSANKGYLTINASEEMEQVEVYNLQGRLVLETKVRAASFETALPERALYILKVKLGDRTVIRKVMSTN